MKVAHVVNAIKGTTIAPEIANAISNVEGVDIGVAVIGSDNSSSKELPDTIDSSLIIRRGSDFSSYVDLLRHLVSQKYKIVHTHHNSSAAMVSIWSKLFPLIHVNTQHGHIHYSCKQKIINSITLLFCNNFTYVSNVTMQSYNATEDIFRSKGTHRVIHNGISVSAINGYAEKKAINEVNRIVTACRLIPRKNIKSLLESMKMMSDKDLVIVGGGELLQDLQEEAVRCGVDERVHFTGYVKHRSEVYNIMSSCDCFVFPSHSEGFGVAVVEAMALGLPVVVSDIPIFREVVGDGGIFVNENDPSEIAAAVNLLASCPKRAQAIGRKNRQRATSHFNYRKIAYEYVDMYINMFTDQVISARPST